MWHTSTPRAVARYEGVRGGGGGGGGGSERKRKLRETERERGGGGGERGNIAESEAHQGVHCTLSNDKNGYSLQILVAKME